MTTRNTRACPGSGLLCRPSLLEGRQVKPDQRGEEDTSKIVLDGTQSGVPSLSLPVGFFGTHNWRGAGYFHARLLACGPRTLLAV